jgi:hypothetical protein
MVLAVLVRQTQYLVHLLPMAVAEVVAHCLVLLVQAGQAVAVLVVHQVWQVQMELLT